MRIWIALIVAPLLALTDQTVAFALVHWACAHQSTWVVHLSHVVFLALAAAAAVGAWLRWRETAISAGSGEGDGPVSLSRRRRDDGRRVVRARDHGDVDSDLDDLVMYRIACVASCVARAMLGVRARAAKPQTDGVEQGFLVVLVVALVLGAFLYAKGIVALWRKAGVGRGIRRGQSVNFALGWAALAGSLLSPIDGWAERSFAVHMIQHELLMVVAAPLIVLGRPLEAWTWALSGPARRFFAAAAKTPVLRTIGYVTTLRSAPGCCTRWRFGYGICRYSSGRRC